MRFLQTGVGIGHPGAEEAVYVGAGQEGQGVVAVFDATTGKLQHAWSGAGTLNKSFTRSEGSHVGFLSGVAVDGSASLETKGEVYVSTAPLGFFPSFSVVDVFKPEAGGEEPAKATAELRGTCAVEESTCPGEEVPFQEPRVAAVSAFNSEVGIAAVARVTGLAQSTVRDGIKDLRSEEEWPVGAQRRAGAGRPALVDGDETLVADLEGLLEPATRGDPESLLKWTNKSAATLARELQVLGHEIVDRSVLRLADRLGFTMQANRKTREGKDHPDRDAQFQYIDGVAKAALAAKQPVISVDTKKKELVGNFKAVGRERTRTGQPVKVSTHDFPSHAVGKAVAYGVLDIASDEGVRVGRCQRRHRAVRGRQHPRVVGAARHRALPARQHLDDHRGLRRLQQRPRQAVEDRGATPG